ncbi:MAG: glycoside hydrolase family 99-like domain-containing protein [Treponemataceae bacterium]|nr:glycoside hydrolase family 99-like domain-containing protein [Treponemataceae bacterium]
MKRNNKAARISVATILCLVSLNLLSSCVTGSASGLSAVETSVTEGVIDYDTMYNEAVSLLAVDPGVRSRHQPKVLVHYMPWFSAPDTSDGYGFHWHQGGTAFDPYTVLDNGQANIASHLYPLTGPYDSRDTAVLEYQAALMKVCGIDGVIFDWYGIHNALDYAEVHANTMAMIEVLRRAGLSYCICYEDQSIKHMIEGGVIAKQDAVATAREVFNFMEDEWFHDPLYVMHDGRPVVLCFGPQYFFQQKQWDEIFGGCENRPWFVSLEDHSNELSDGQYNWFNMNGEKTPKDLVKQINRFYENQSESDFLVATAFAGFHDIYAQTGATSYGYLDYADGRAFDLTLQAAIAANADIIQIATWNDYGEGTCIEPTVEHGYNELTVLQNLRGAAAAGSDQPFPWRAQDIRGPLAVYRILADSTADDAKREAARAAMDALLAGDAAAYRSAIRAGKITVDFAVRPMLRTPTSGGTEKPFFDNGGRTNVALGAPVIVTSHIYDFTGRKACDGDVTTYWEGAAGAWPCSVTLDLVSEKNLDVAVVKLNPKAVWGPRSQTLAVETSTDNENWTIIIPETSYQFDPAENQNTVVLPLHAAARYVRFTFTANTGATAGQAAEIELYQEPK